MLPTPAPADYDPATASLRSTLALLGRGNLLYVNDSADLDAVASCWAAAAMHPPQERAALFASIDWAVQGYTHTPRNYALDLFHWAWLAPSLPAGLGAFRQALQLDPKLGDVMQRVLFHATAPQAQGTLLPQLGKTFCLLLGELAWAQQALAASLRAGAFVDANQLACELQEHSRRPFVAHWASFICAFELNGGTQLPGHFDQERTKNIFWARGLVATVRGWNGDQHALAQGALAQQDYRMVWQMFLARYAALCPGDFVAPPRLMAASNLRGSNNRCLGGLLWSDLIQLPFPKKWAAYQVDLMQEYVQCSEPVLCSPEALRLPRLSLVAANQ